jgi:hypothetical protein
MPKSKANSNGTMPMKIASAPMPVAIASQTAAATTKPVAALSGPPGIRLRRRFGGVS